MKLSGYLLLGFLLVVGTANAQTIPDNNVLAFYFDEGATDRSWYGTGDVTAYLVAGPLISVDGDFQVLNSWAADEILILPFENVSSAHLVMRGAAYPAELEMTSMWAVLDVGLADPLPLNGRTVVAELRLNVLSEETTQLHVWGGEFIADGTWSHFAILTSGGDGPMDMTGHTANINGDSPVPSSPASWGAVKSLFR